ncbi:SET domain-containing protein 5 [Saxophila tyrrhenica]|uniref:SET domain-containing protein 5 n=1 Tax=Saxophila tyrrhenica TaxID=1690608 RepID=A0AAV9PDP6_9PEZI|nr:SET domain-containing protein 5 [Saxophila tyrrhenica]
MPKLYEVKDSPGKGKGMFATVNIKAGDLIMREDGRMKIVGFWRRDHREKQAEAEVQQAFLALSPAEKQEIIQLRDDTTINGSKIVRIYLTNAKSEKGDSVIYLKMARLNHSCVPNAEMGGFGGVAETTLVATRKINKGEEIFITYRGEHLDGPRAERHQGLMRVHRFVCECRVCSLTGRELVMSDIRRKLFQSLVSRRFEAMPTAADAQRAERGGIPRESGSSLTYREKVAYSFLTARIMEAEGMSGVIIGDSYFSAAMALLAQIQNMDTFIVLPSIEFLRELFELTIKATSEIRDADSPEVRNVKSYWTFLQEHNPQVKIGLGLIKRVASEGIPASKAYAKNMMDGSFVSRAECLEILKKERVSPSV